LGRGRSRAGAGTAPVDGLLYAHCPERILPGQMLKELIANDRIVGGLTPEASARAKALYEIFKERRSRDGRPHGRARQTDRERVPRRQHRLRERAVDDLRPGSKSTFGNSSALANRHPGA
jgi:hypothetical protein